MKYQDVNPPKQISLFCVSVRLSSNSEHKKFELLTADSTHEFYAESDKELLQWTALLEVINITCCLFYSMKDVCHNLVHESIGSEQNTRPLPLRRTSSVNSLHPPQSAQNWFSEEIRI